MRHAILFPPLRNNPHIRACVTHILSTHSTILTSYPHGPPLPSTTPTLSSPTLSSRVLSGSTSRLTRPSMRASAPKVYIPNDG